MNERIFKLIEECTFIYDDLVYDGTDSYMKTSEYFDKEKFAELIVGECVNICMKNQFDGAENYNNGSVSSAEFIKEHFGVEE